MNAKICTTCQSTIPESAPGGLCPACVLRGADETPPGLSNGPALEAVAAAFPKLEIIRLIGHGGMGFVYQARQPELDRTVALKILSPTLRNDPAFEERFAREARVLGKLKHPNIVTLYEHGEGGGYFYLLMEYIDGVNLRQAMSAGRFTPEQALAIVPAICDALQTAHAEGVWHRDIKPENILLDKDGRVKIADFGIARILGDPERNFTLTRTGGLLGSAAYMAPEQHEKPHSVDHRADIYSLGVVIYEMLTGELPLGRFPLPSQRAEVNARIDEIVMRTLEKERELRQQSADEVKTEVEGVNEPSPRESGGIAATLIQSRKLGVLSVCLLWLGIIIAPLLLATVPSCSHSEAGVVRVILLTAAFLSGLLSWRLFLGRLSIITAVIVLAFPSNDFFRLVFSTPTSDSAVRETESKVGFRFTHKEAGRGAVYFIINANNPELSPYHRDRGWQPDGGRLLPLESGRKIWCRARIIDHRGGAVRTLVECSEDETNWETQIISVSRINPTNLFVFKNGVKLSARFGRDEEELYRRISEDSEPRYEPSSNDQKSSSEAVANLPEILVNLLEDGTLRVKDTTVELKQLGDRLSMLALKQQDQPVRIRAARKVPYQRLLEVIGTCQNSGIWNISFSNESSTESEDGKESNGPTDAPSPAEPGGAMQIILKAARERNARVFQNGISKSFKASLREHGEDLGNFGDFGNCTFISANQLDATNSEVVVEANDGSKRRFTFPMILEDGEWRLNGVEAKP